MVIGFIRSGVHPENVKAYKIILENSGSKVIAICENLIEKKQYDKEIKVYCLEDWLSAHWRKFNKETLYVLCQKYKQYNFWEVYYTDRYMRYKYTYDEAIKFICGMVSFWEYVYTDSNVNYIASDCIIGANAFIGMIVGQAFGVPYISTQTARYKKYYTYFSYNEGYANVVFDKLISAIDKAVSKKEIKNAEKYVNAYINYHTQPFYIRENVNASRNLKGILVWFLKRFWKINHFFNSEYNNKFNPHDYKDKWGFLNSIKEVIRQRAIKKYLNNPDYDDNYFLCPLHFQPEASTCVYARKYENQILFIEQLAKSIPIGKILYVKEHSVRKGHKPLSFYKELKKFPNVKIITWDADIHDLIRNASAIVCLTSTVGFEALMYGKPVFICGKTFFNNFSGVKSISDVFDEKESFLNPPIQDRTLYIKQMACYLKTMQFCTFQEEPLHEENLENLLNIQKASVMELLKFINKIESGEIQWTR